MNVESLMVLTLCDDGVQTLRELLHGYVPELRMPIALAESACKESVDNLNQLLADTMTLRDLCKKHHWQVCGPTFHQLHLLFDKHYAEQSTLIDAIAERIQLLGDVSIAMARTWPRRPSFRVLRRDARLFLSRLLACW